MTSLTYFPLAFEVVFHAAIFCFVTHCSSPLRDKTKNDCLRFFFFFLGGGGGGGWNPPPPPPPPAPKPPMPEYQVHQLLWTKFSVTPTVFSKDVFFIFSVYFDIRFVMPVTALNSFRNNWDEKLPIKLKLVIRARIAFMQTFLSSEQLTVCWLF